MYNSTNMSKPVLSSIIGNMIKLRTDTKVSVNTCITSCACEVLIFSVARKRKKLKRNSSMFIRKAYKTTGGILPVRDVLMSLKIPILFCKAIVNYIDLSQLYVQ